MEENLLSFIVEVQKECLHRSIQTRAEGICKHIVSKVWWKSVTLSRTNFCWFVNDVNKSVFFFFLTNLFLTELLIEPESVIYNQNSFHWFSCIYVNQWQDNQCILLKNKWFRDFLVVQWLRISLNAEDMGSISGPGTKILHAIGQLSPPATNTEPAGLEPMLHNERSHSKEKPAYCN